RKAAMDGCGSDCRGADAGMDMMSIPKWANPPGVANNNQFDFQIRSGMSADLMSEKQPWMAASVNLDLHRNLNIFYKIIFNPMNEENTYSI
ncbi:MAG: hypothetical protein KAU22_03460, partial [Desulfuromonadales bacterium]|nr:hypothetical protein [Desulfuromonadales bacterium]